MEAEGDLSYGTLALVKLLPLLNGGYCTLTPVPFGNQKNCGHNTSGYEASSDLYCSLLTGKKFVIYQRVYYTEASELRSASKELDFTKYLLRFTSENIDARKRKYICFSRNFIL